MGNEEPARRVSAGRGFQAEKTVTVVDVGTSWAGFRGRREPWCRTASKGESSR